jgi:acetyltransferase-like isoleucine patch superfamily enzyme
MSHRYITRIRTFLHPVVSEVIRQYYNGVWGTRIGKGSRISTKCHIDKTFPAGVVIGEYTIITLNATILTHDFVNARHLGVNIGSYCFIGTGALIMPGVTIGDHCIIGAKSVVTHDVPPNSVVVGIPGRVIESSIQTREWGIRIQKGLGN